MSVNRVTLLGRLGKDPELRHTTSGAAVAGFSLATSETWRDKQTGSKQEKTTWHNCVAWGKPGEVIAQYCKKGDQLYVEGSIENRKYEKDGAEKYITEIKVREFTLLGSRTESNAVTPAQSRPQPAQDDYDDSDVPF
jgi:single-strand DNA-binding protein